MLELRSQFKGENPSLNKLSIIKPSEKRSDFGLAHLFNSHSGAVKLRSLCVILGSLLVNGMACIGFCWRKKK